MKAYRAIGSYYEVIILPEKQPKVYKIKTKTESKRFLIILGSKTYLVYIFIRNIIIKTPFIKLYKSILKEVSKLIEIWLLNDVAITKNSTGERVSLDLPEIDDIGFSESITSEVPRSLELPALRLSRPLELENRSSELVFRPFEEPIKLIGSSNPDKMQLNLVISLYYQIKVKIFKKKLDKNSFIPNIYK